MATHYRVTLTTAERSQLDALISRGNTHEPASLYEAFPPQEARRLIGKLEIHHTPKHGSWLNMAEIELSAFRSDLPERIARKETLERHTAAWQDRRNAASIRADWRFTAEDARIRLKRLYPTIQP